MSSSLINIKLGDQHYCTENTKSKYTRICTKCCDEMDKLNVLSYLRGY